MGFSDIGCYGGEINTPNLNKLAAEGVRFTQFHNTARCCPSRASILTGLYPHEAGIGHMTDATEGDDGNLLPGYAGRLNDNCVTIAEALHRAGYFTAMAGKWHVGQNFGVVPWNRGFDRSLNCAAGGIYFPGTPGGGPLYLNGKDVGRSGGGMGDKWYSSDLWTEYSLKFIDDAKTAKKPFFLYLAENAPHFPLQAPPEDIARWRGKYKAGWDKLREARYDRQIQMGLIDKSWPLSPRLPEVPAWDSLTPAQQDRYDNIMAIYAAVVEHLDKSIGDLVAGLKQRGELDNTVILFISDNGGNAESGINGRLEGANPGDPHSTVFVGQCWATLNNTPFVRYKHYTDEGGIATPLVVHWPAGIPAARDGRLEPQTGHLIDIMPTCLDLAGGAYPTTFNGHDIKPEEGISLRPAFAGSTIARPHPIFWEHESNRAVLDGKYKLVALANKPWRLYDIVADRTEQHDLAAAEPDLVKTLSAEWDDYAARANVLPLGAWRHAGGPPQKFSTATHFALKNDEHLVRKTAPNIGDRAITITATFDAKPGGGVIVAQGGAAQGFTLYEDAAGKLTFLVRRDNETSAITTTTPILGPHTAIGHLAADGALSLTVDTQPALHAKAPGALRMPVEGLDVGSDRGAPVGPYGKTNTFHGNITSVVIDLEPAKQEVQ